MSGGRPGDPVLDSGAGFLARWSQRKARAQRGEALPEPAAPAHAGGALPAAATAPARTALAPQACRDADLDAHAVAARGVAAQGVAAQGVAAQGAGLTDAATVPDAAPPAPTLADAAQLAPGAEIRRFVAPGVDPAVKNAALKQLFADPHFNRMDGLDTYIDDYGLADPLPAGMLRALAQSQFVGLFAQEPEPEPEPAPAAACAPAGAAESVPSAILTGSPDPGGPGPTGAARPGLATDPSHTA